ncbi:EF-hand domain-containing protein [Candidatus Uabimicrobium amorphum]|uniref:Calcium sensor EFh n=1 Tax=Uabimicrobium amorphum TaxID=2596890 RepID=A0A5S9INW9_UABAM|nr:EF-hand domain-containing protein [Candidatus Uabimicrobium amorphum]BBM84761.1 calcium sensor EFh [Candidatus Uabimicrobium amorphum]
MKYLYLTILLTALCYAQNARVDRFFKLNDTNGDGQVTQEELKDANAFNILDKNGDGVITRNEIDPNAPASEAQQQEDQKNKKGKMFIRFDINSDGKISKEEWPGNQQVFNKLDENQDGFLTKNEVNKQALRRMKRNPNKEQRQGLVSRLDANGDGSISSDEWKGPQKIFNHLDKNSDNIISPDELPRGKRNNNPKKMLQRIDKNQDGKISKDEWPRNPQAFDRLDKNQDGFITRDEMKQIQKMQKMQGGKNHLKKLQKMLQKMDQNQDQKIDASEWRGDVEKFSKLDGNGDGFLTKEEIQQQIAKRFRNKGREGNSDGGNFRDKMRNRLKMLDRDNDGKISQEEWPGNLERFEQMDRNGDGFLSEEDRKQR